MPNWESIDLEKSKLSYMIGGTENKYSFGKLFAASTEAQHMYTQKFHS